MVKDIYKTYKKFRNRSTLFKLLRYRASTKRLIEKDCTEMIRHYQTVHLDANLIKIRQRIRKLLGFVDFKALPF